MKFVIENSTEPQEPKVALNIQGTSYGAFQFCGRDEKGHNWIIAEVDSKTNRVCLNPAGLRELGLTKS